MSEHAQNLRLSLLLSLGLAGPMACSNKEPKAGGTTAAPTDQPTASTDPTPTEPPTASTDPVPPEAPATTALTAVPEAEYPVCTGEGHPGFTGPCCVDVYCVDMPEGASTCPSPRDLGAGEITGKSLGSGACSCGEDGIGGPFEAYKGKDGDCCYTVGIMACTGRPLLVAGLMRRATLQRGEVWG